MQLPDIEFYTVDGLAKHFQVEENHIWQHLETKKIKPSVYVNNLPVIIYELIEFDGVEYTIDIGEGYLTGAFSLPLAQEIALIKKEEIILDFLFSTHTGNLHSQNWGNATPLLTQADQFREARQTTPPRFISSRKFIPFPELYKDNEPAQQNIKSKGLSKQEIQELERMKDKEAIDKYNLLRGKAIQLTKLTPIIYAENYIDIKDMSGLYAFQAIPRWVDSASLNTSYKMVVPASDTLQQTGFFDYTPLAKTFKDIRITKYQLSNGNGINNNADNISNKERENLLKTIGILSYILVEKTEKNGSKLLGTAVKPKVSKVAELIQNYVASCDKFSKTGLSQSTLNDKIKEAISFIQEEI